MNEMRRYTISTTTITYQFVGKHLPDRERPNWHYYQEEDGTIIHFRKEHMVIVVEKELEDANGQLAN